MRLHRLGIAAALAAGLLSAPSAAHHSYAPFDRERTVVVDGVVEEVDWVNPHIVIAIRTEEGELYRIEWRSPSNLSRHGVDANPFAVGERLCLTGSPHRDPDEKVVTLITEITRVSDGWRWARASTLAPPTPAELRPRAGGAR